MSEEKSKVWPDDGQFAILELMGHVRMGGLIREVTLFGQAMCRIDVPSECSGVSAGWCPVHGDCVCDEEKHGGKNDPACPLHAETSKHGEEWLTTQFVSPASIYRLTPCGEAEARAVARSNRVQPVTRWEMTPALPQAPPGVGDDHDDEDDDRPF